MILILGGGITGLTCAAALKVDVILIEAQVGEYLDEDDIVRIEDDFKRIYE